MASKGAQPGVAGSRGLLGLEQFVQVGFVEDGDSEVLGLVEFAAGLGAANDVGCLVGDTAGDAAALRFDGGPRLASGPGFKATGDYEGLAFQWAPGGGCCLGGFGFDAGVEESAQLVGVFFLIQEGPDGGGGLGAEPLDAGEGFLFRAQQVVDSFEGVGEGPGVAGADVGQAQGGDEPVQAWTARGVDGVDEVARGLFAVALQLCDLRLR